MKITKVKNSACCQFEVSKAEPIFALNDKIKKRFQNQKRVLKPLLEVMGIFY